MESRIPIGTLGRALFLAAALVLAGCAGTINTRTAITDVTIIDAVSGSREHQTVVFDGDSIVAVVPASEAPRAGTTIDGTGKFLIPGLWDMHVHLTYDSRFTATMPQTFLRYGITSVRDTGGQLELLRPVIDAMRAADAVAPRVFFSGPLLDGEHVVYNGQSVPELGLQNLDVDDARRAVRQLHADGVDFVKIYEMVSPEVFVAIAQTAQELGLPIASHVPLSMTASGAAPYVHSMEHLRNIELDCAAHSEELLDLRKAALANTEQLSGLALRGQLHRQQRQAAITAVDDERCAMVIASLRRVIQVPTAGLNTLALWPAWEHSDWQSALLNMPADVRAEWQTAPTWFKSDIEERDTRFAQHTLQMIAAMRAAGVPIGAGTDTPIARAIPGHSLHSELEVLVQAGLTPLEALESATIRPAEFFSLQHSMGSISVGKRADMVLLGTNPLIDIQNTRDIVDVIFRGRVLDASTQ